MFTILIIDETILHADFISIISSQPVKGVILELITSDEIMCYLWSATPFRQRQIVAESQMVSRGRIPSHYREKEEEQKAASSNFGCLTFLWG